MLFPREKWPCLSAHLRLIIDSNCLQSITLSLHWFYISPSHHSYRYQVLCSDNVERQSSLSCLRSLLSLLHPVSFLYMLEVLIKESPFPSVRGLLLDTLKWRSQACVSSGFNKFASPIIHGDHKEVKVGQQSWPWLPLKPHSLSIDKALCSCSSSYCQSSFSCQDNRQQVLLLWRGPSSSIFFSSIVLQIFCIPNILKIGNATTGQLLASADEFGGAINLLQHSALKMKGIVASLQRDLKSPFRELADFLGWAVQTHCDCLLMDCVDSRARAITDVRSFFYNDVQLAVESVEAWSDVLRHRGGYAEL